MTWSKNSFHWSRKSECDSQRGWRLGTRLCPPRLIQRERDQQDEWSDLPLKVNLENFNIQLLYKSVTFGFTIRSFQGGCLKKAAINPRLKKDTAWRECQTVWCKQNLSSITHQYGVSNWYSSDFQEKTFPLNLKVSSNVFKSSWTADLGRTNNWGL